MTQPAVVLSLGAGVQSSTLAFMAARGILPQPDAVVFADTGAEPDEVYRWLDWMRGELPFEIVTVRRGNLADEATRLRRSKRTGREYQSLHVPMFVRGERGHSMLAQSCSQAFKIAPVYAWCKEQFGVGFDEQSVRVRFWLGISTDEAHRMKPARELWAKNEWPLIELGMDRADCLRWMRDHGYPEPPRSACVFCPFRSNAEWRRLAEAEPHSVERAAEFERAAQETAGSVGRLGSLPYVHRTLVPISDAPYEEVDSPSLFGGDCEGICGV